MNFARGIRRLIIVITVPLLLVSAYLFLEAAWHRITRPGAAIYWEKQPIAYLSSDYDALESKQKLAVISRVNGLLSLYDWGQYLFGGFDDQRSCKIIREALSSNQLVPLKALEYDKFWAEAKATLRLKGGKKSADLLSKLAEQSDLSGYCQRYILSQVGLDPRLEKIARTAIRAPSSDRLALGYFTLAVAGSIWTLFLAGLWIARGFKKEDSSRDT